MATGDLTTLPNALAWINCQSDDGFGTIQRMITVVSTMIKNNISRQILSANYVTTLDGRGRTRIMLPNTPITAVSQVLMTYGPFASLSIPPRTAGGAGYTFSTTCVYVDPPYMFEKGIQNVQISYTGGFTTVPPDIEQACLTWIRVIMEGQNYSAAVAKAKAGQTQLDFSFILTALSKETHLPMPPAVWSMLSNYIRVAPSW